MNSIPSPQTKLIRSLISEIASMRLRRVCAYQRDFTPLPFSPRFIRLAPGAIIPPRCTRFRTMVAKARSRSPLGSAAKTDLTDLRVMSKVVIFSASFLAPPFRITFQTQAVNAYSLLLLLFGPKVLRLSATVRPSRRGEYENSEQYDCHGFFPLRSHVTIREATSETRFQSIREA